MPKALISKKELADAATKAHHDYLRNLGVKNPEKPGRKQLKGYVSSPLDVKGVGTSREWTEK